jgi:hypothetical protein
MITHQNQVHQWIEERCAEVLWTVRIIELFIKRSKPAFKIGLFSTASSDRAMSSPLLRTVYNTSAHLSSFRWCKWFWCVIIILGMPLVEMKACFGKNFHNSNFAARWGGPALWRWWHLRELLGGLSRVLSGLSDIWQAMRTMTVAGDWPRAGRPAVPTKPFRPSQPPSHLDPLPRMRYKDRHNSATKCRRNLFQNRKRMVF